MPISLNSLILKNISTKLTEKITLRPVSNISSINPTILIFYIIKDKESGFITAYRFWWGKLRQRDHLEDLGLDGRIILKLIFREYDGAVNWIDLFQEDGKECDFVNMVIRTVSGFKKYAARLTI